MADTDQQFTIPQAVQDKYPDLALMLKNSKSIDAGEKQYWFTALETMDDSQVASLRQILEDEIKQLQQVETQAVAETKQAVDTVEQELLEKKRQEDAAARKKAEEEDEKNDAVRQADLLAQLEQI